MRNLIRLALLVALGGPAAAAALPAGPDAAGHAVLAQATVPETTPTPPDDAESAQEPETETDEARSGEADAVPEEEAAPAEDTEAASEPEEESAAPEETRPAPEPREETEATPDPQQETGPAEESRILRSETAMPEPVRKTWRALVQAAESGRIENLQPIIDEQPEPPMVAFNDVADPIAHLRSLSGDAEGREVLAILLEVLRAGFLHVDEGTPQEMYLWPYFARYPVDDLTPAQMVELFTLLTAGDYQDMLSYGAYIFFRVGITADGRWLFFLAGD